MFFYNVAEVTDIANMEATLQTRFAYEEIIRTIGKLFEKEGAKVKLLSSESCAYCEGETCRHPEHMIPCIESQGTLVTELAEKYEITFLDSMITV